MEGFFGENQFELIFVCVFYGLIFPGVTYDNNNIAIWVFPPNLIHNIETSRF